MKPRLGGTEPLLPPTPLLSCGDLNSSRPSSAATLRELQAEGSGLASRALLPSPTPRGSLSPLPVAPPSRYRLDQQLQVSGLERVLILGVQMLKLLQEAQVIQLYIWMRGRGEKPNS